MEPEHTIVNHRTQYCIFLRFCFTRNKQKGAKAQIWEDLKVPGIQNHKCLNSNLAFRKFGVGDYDKNVSKIQSLRTDDVKMKNKAVVRVTKEKV